MLLAWRRFNLSTHSSPLWSCESHHPLTCLPTLFYILQSDIDMAATDKHCRVFEDDFKIEMFFSNPVSKLADNFREVAPPSFRVLECARKHMMAVSLGVCEFRPMTRCEFNCVRACIHIESRCRYCLAFRRCALPNKIRSFLCSCSALIHRTVPTITTLVILILLFVGRSVNWKVLSRELRRRSASSGCRVAGSNPCRLR